MRLPADERCGKPTGEPCGVALECHSTECTSPLALAAGLLGAILPARRRSDRSTKPNDNQDQD